MIARLILAAAVILLSLGLAARAEQLTPENFTCEKAFGPGYTPHPRLPFSCCWPGWVAVPGKDCVKAGPASAPPAGGSASSQDAPTVNNQPSSNIRDAEGRPGAPGGHCIPTGLSCTIGGASCCASGASCQGKFPNTVCK